MHLGIVQVNLTLLLVFTVFATMMAEFQHETVLDFGLCKSLLLGTRPEGQDVGPQATAIMNGVFMVFVLIILTSES